MKQYRRQVDELEGKLQEEQKLNGVLKESVESLQKDQTQKRLLLDEFQMNTLNEQISSLEKEKSQLKKNFENEKNQRLSMEKKFLDQDILLQQTIQKMNAQEKQLKTLMEEQKTLREKTQEINQLSNENMEIEIQFQKKIKELQSQLKKQESLEKRLEELHQENQKLSANQKQNEILGELRNDEELMREIENLLNENDVLQNKLNQIGSQQKKELKKVKDEFQKQIDEQGLALRSLEESAKQKVDPEVFQAVEKNYIDQVLKITKTLDQLKTINIKDKYRRTLMDSLTN